MTDARPENPCTFAAEPLDRASAARAAPGWLESQLADPSNLLLPLFAGDPLLRGREPAFLSAAALGDFPAEAPVVFLGRRGETAYFAIDSARAPDGDPARAPFADIGRYAPLREAAGDLSGEDLAIIGQARWLFDWHRRHRHCAVCGGVAEMAEGGAKRQCPACGAEHFPRSDPVAIVLAIHEDACLLGRGPHFPPGFLSALAGYVEAAETPEECAVRELREEAGVDLTAVRYLFSQPWPFPSSLMMGFIAQSASRELVLDETEIVEARWLTRGEINALRNGAHREDVRLPPRFTIARQLIDHWADEAP